MLKLAARLALALIFIGAALTAVIPRVFPNSPNAPDYWNAFGFGACDLPCYAGIRLGDAEFDRTVERLEEHVENVTQSALVVGETIYFQAAAHGHDLTGSISFVQGRVVALSLGTDVPVDLLLTAFGAPDCVLIIPNAMDDWWYWYLPDAVITAQMNDHQQPQTATADYMTIVPLGDSSGCDVTLMTPWRGFAPSWVYRN